MDYEKYLVRKPVYESCSGFKNRQSPTMTYMSKAQVSVANCYLELGWISGLPEPNPHISEHVHDFDEVLTFIGTDPDAPYDLCGEIEFWMEDEKMSITRSCSVFVPKGMKHCPFVVRRVDRPIFHFTTGPKGMYR